MIAPNVLSQIGNAAGPILFQIKETPAGPAQDESGESSNRKAWWVAAHGGKHRQRRRANEIYFGLRQMEAVQPPAADWPASPHRSESTGSE
jgi:hypothetical protein